MLLIKMRIYGECITLQLAHISLEWRLVANFLMEQLRLDIQCYSTPISAAYGMYYSRIFRDDAQEIIVQEVIFRTMEFIGASLRFE